MEGYAAMVGTIDESVGRLREILGRLGELENTLFVFFSDHGAAGVGGHDIGGPASWPAYATGWAATANTPFRHHKFSTYRGGHQVSFLMSWPAGLPEAAGPIRSQYAHVTDLAPTILDLIGIPVATERDGLDARTLDGVSMTGIPRIGDAVSDHTEQYYECLGERAYYAGDWEAVAARKTMTRFESDRWELFDTAADPTQLDDLAAEHPERTSALIAAWREAAEQNQVFPLADGSPLHWFQRDPFEAGFAQPVTLLPEAATLERFRASQLTDGRSFEFEVALAGYEAGDEAGDEGVLLAHGGQESGYVLYIEDGLLRLVQNAWGRMIAAEPVAVPVGATSVVVRVRGTRQGDGRRGSFPYSGALSRIEFRPGEFAPDAMSMMVEQFKLMGATTQ